MKKYSKRQKLLLVAFWLLCWGQILLALIAREGLTLITILLSAFIALGMVIVTLNIIKLIDDN